MNLLWPMVTTITFLLLICEIWCAVKFSGEECVAAHNDLRRRHVDTKVVAASKRLHQFAKQYANILNSYDYTMEIHPTRSVPARRKRRSLEDGIDETKHLELWEGDITFPSSRKDDRWLENKNKNRETKITRSIHKFCCGSSKPFPHCPKEFFHGLSFPPTADGVVKDIYNQEEKHYDYETGKSKTIYSHVNHFAKIVWKNSSGVGCAQSRISRDGCVFTVILYTGIDGDDAYKENIGLRIVPDQAPPAQPIVLGIFIAALVIGLIILLYCCRHNIDEKYQSTMIKVDVMKAEQELETDSTSLWWLRPVLPRHKSPKAAEPTSKSIRYQSVKEKPTIEVVPNAPRPSLASIPRPSLHVSLSQPDANVNQLINRYKGMSLKRSVYQQRNLPERPPVPTAKPPLLQQDDREDVLIRTPSKSTPPFPNNGAYKPSRPKPPASNSKPTPVVVKPNVTHRSSPPVTRRPDLPQVTPPAARSGEVPRPVPRKMPTAPAISAPALKDPTVEGGGKKPMLPPKRPAAPKVVEKDTEDEERPMSIAERRRQLEGNN